MSERSRAEFNKVARLALAGVQTAGVIGPIRLSTLKPEGVRNWLDTIFTNPDFQNHYLFK